MENLARTDSKVTVQCYQSIDLFNIVNSGSSPDTREKINVLYINSQSIKNKLDKIEAYLAQINSETHIIAVTETWVAEHEKKFYNLPDYTVAYSSRAKRGGGCAIFCRNNLTANIVQETEKNDITYLCIYVEEIKMHFSVIYNPSKKRYNVQDTLEILEEQLSQQSDKNSWVLGDLNIDLLQNNNNCSRYKDLCISNGFFLCNETVATRKSQSLIDHVMTNIQNVHLEVAVIKAGISDHDLQYLTINTSSQLKSKTFTYKKKVVNIPQLKLDIKRLNDSYISPAHSVDENYEALVKCFSNNTTYKQINVKARKINKPWFTLEIQHGIQTNDYYYRKAQRHPNNEYLKAKHKESKKYLKCIIRRAKNEYYSSKLGQVRGNTKKEWQVLNQIVTNSNRPCKKTVSTLKIRNKTISNTKCISERLNSYFTTVAASLASKIKKCKLNLDLEKESSKKFQFQETTFVEVLKIIEDLDPTKAPGYDDIDVKTIKTCRFEVASVLYKIINQSFCVGEVPVSMKLAKVSPLYKGGDSQQCNNYRPVSVLPIMSKIMEKTANSQLTNFLNNIDFFYPCQYGFRESSDTMSATLDLIGDIQKKLNEKQKGAMVSLDLRKAFDTVDHGILLLKLKKLGLMFSTHKWFSSFLDPRKQFVSLDGTQSSEKNLNCGVPQGSIIAPTLFLIYINSISKLKLSGMLRLYADDTLLVYFGHSFDTLKIHIKNDLKLISKWLDSHKLSLNIEKSSYICLSNKKCNFSEPIIIDQSKILQYSTQIKYLGLWIDETLTWQYHIETLRKRIRGPIGILKKLNALIPKKFLRPLFFSLIQSQLQYLIGVWFPTKKMIIQPLITLHKKAIKNIYCLPHTFPTLQLYEYCKIKSLEDIFKTQICTFIHQIVNSDKHSTTKFNKRINVHLHNTRYCNNLEVIRPKNNFGVNSIFFKGVKIYNNLPSNLKMLNTTKFKNKIKNHVFST